MNIKAARKALDWSQSELARRSGVAQQRISQLERGDYVFVSYRDVVRIVRAFRKAGLKGITAEELFPVNDDTGEGK
jgi:transcriptional regulator with XRE-family HTH domain